MHKLKADLFVCIVCMYRLPAVNPWESQLRWSTKTQDQSNGATLLPLLEHML